jgi:hypothetical protein
VVQEIETRTMTIRLGEDGIIRIAQRALVTLSLADAHELVAAEQAILRGRKVPCLVDMRNVKSMSRESRLFLAGPETAKLHLAGALVTTSPLGKALANFFMGLNKPLVPTRMFTSDEQALGWLRGFLPRPVADHA